MNVNSNFYCRYGKLSRSISFIATITLGYIPNRNVSMEVINILSSGVKYSKNPMKEACYLNQPHNGEIIKRYNPYHDIRKA